MDVSVRLRVTPVTATHNRGSFLLPSRLPHPTYRDTAREPHDGGEGEDKGEEGEEEREREGDYVRGGAHWGRGWIRSGEGEK